MTPRSWVLATLVAVGVLFQGCAATPYPGQSTREIEPAGAGVDAQYIIGPGDVLRVVVLGDAQLNAEVPVRPDGKISTPLANDVVAAGKTPTQLSHDLDAVLSEYVRDPSVSVIVVQSTSRFSQVKVVGQAVNPRAVPFRNGMTVLDLIIEVGGLSQFAAGNRAKLIREHDGQVQEIRVRLNDLLNKGRVSENIPLAPGDILVVPETLF